MPRKKKDDLTATAVKSQYYDMSKLLSTNATYRMVFGERSNGKTFAILSECLRDYFATGARMGYIRRFTDDFRGKRGAVVFDSVCSEGIVEKLSKGEYNSVYYYSGRWWLQRVDDGVVTLKSNEPFAYAFSLTSMEHDKGSSYPEIRNVFFDEFMSRTGYLHDEFILFMNTISTIVRQRKDVRIFMAANSVNKVCTYTTEMGLTKFAQMKQGDLDVYSYGNSGLTVAIEYSDTPAKSKPSDIYFAFDNPKLHMIKGTNGGWEIAPYPKLPCTYKPSDVVYEYLILYEKMCFHCEVIKKDYFDFTYIHEKTTNIKDDNLLIYDINNEYYDYKYNHRKKEHINEPYDVALKKVSRGMINIKTNIKRPASEVENQFFKYFKLDKVFYQSNEIGEYIRNYLLECK